MEEKRTPRNRCELACWVITGLAGYAGLLAWAAGSSPLVMVMIAAAAGIAAAILEAGGD